MSKQLVTVARYRDLPEALLAQGMLEAAGIPCRLMDDNIVRMDWFWSNMVGGIRLQVDGDEADEAIELLASPIPDELPGPDEASHFHQPACPKRGSLDIAHDTRRQWLSIAMLYFTALPIPLSQSKAWHCWDCGAYWFDEEEKGA